MIDQLGELPGRPVQQITLRINPGFGHGHSQKTNTGGEQSKHGIWHEQLGECLRRADAPRPADHRAAHAHRLGHRSGASAAGLRGDGASGPRSRRRLEAISAGGGLPVPYRDGETYVDLRPIFPLGRRAPNARRVVRASVRLEIEPGRYLVAESGYLVTEIRAVKQTGNNTFYLVDAGFNNLARPILYGSYHPMSIVPASGRMRKPARARRGRRRPALRVGRYLHAVRKAASSARGSCRSRRSAISWCSKSPGPTDS